MGVEMMNILYTEDYLMKLNDQLIPNHFLYWNGKMKKITAGENWLMDGSFHINCRYLHTKDDCFLAKLSISNLTDQRVTIKIFVESHLNELKKNYIFVSPKKDVLFLTNEDVLFLASGMLNGTSMTQYGVLKRNQYMEKIYDGMIPFIPIGTGNVVGLYTLEQRLVPYETTIAYTWTLASKIFSEKELLSQDEQLKSRLAFS